MITPCYFPVKGGTETVVRNLSMLLNKANIPTDVLTFNTDQWRTPSWQGKTENNDGFSVYKIPALNLLWALRSHRLTMRVNLIPSRFTNILSKYDILHYHELEFSFPLFSSLVRKPKILHCHGLDVQFLRRYWISHMLMKHLPDYCISISRQMTNEMVSLGINRNRIFYLPNGVDVNIFKPYGSKIDNLLLFVGRVTANKGVHMLVNALRYIEKPVQLAIIGPMDNNYRPYILGLIEDENRRGKHKITYLGPMDNIEIAKWYQKASLFVLPSFNEAFPMTILEALACETPVVATPVGGIPEIVRNYNTGILTSRNEPAELANAIQRLLENKDDIVEFGREGRKQVINNFSLETQVKKLSNIYKQMTF
ncbi:MAG: glycosyltransferase family 4 protein [Candidatus Bathyarchaeia archaeon]|jgi:glycosyltransferase involved in cell wall biosynthesis